MKKLASISFIILLISVTIIASYALGEASVQSSEVFRSASLSAVSTGTVTFSATIKNKGDVSVTTCSLERLSEGNWVFVKSLPVPAGKSSTYRYTVSKDYSSSLVHGNSYRFKATFSSNGESRSAISNTIAY